MQPHGLYSLWNSLGQNTGVGSLSFLQGIFLTQGLNSGLPHCRADSLPAEPWGKPKNTGVGSLSLPDPEIEPGSPVLQVDSLRIELSGKPNGTNRLLKSFYSRLCSKWWPVSYCLWSHWRYQHWMGWAGGDFFSHLLMAGVRARKCISRAEMCQGARGLLKGGLRMFPGVWEGQVLGHSSGIIGLLLLGIGCCCLVTESRPDSFCDPVDCSPPGSSVHGISQARILEWVATSFSRGSSQPRDWTRVSCIGRRRATWEAPTELVAVLFLLKYQWYKSQNTYAPTQRA